MTDMFQLVIGVMALIAVSYLVAVLLVPTMARRLDDAFDLSIDDVLDYVPAEDRPDFSGRMANLPPEGAVCIMSGCDRPATHTVPENQYVDVWVCAGHAG